MAVEGAWPLPVTITVASASLPRKMTLCTRADMLLSPGLLAKYLSTAFCAASWLSAVFEQPLRARAATANTIHFTPRF